MANCNPGTRQYIGARYVPRHMGEWSADTQYSALDVVLYTDGNSYTAKCYPPKGTVPTDDKYWALSAQFNQQLSALDSKVQNAENNIIKLFGRSCASVKDYGAVGDGVTDDSNAFREAFANNKAVYIPAGTYKADVTNIGKATFIFGDGRATIIDGGFYNEELIESVHFESLYFKNSESDKTKTALDINCLFCNFENISFSNYKNALNIKTDSYINGFEKCEFFDNDIAVKCGNEFNDMRFTNCVFQRNGTVFDFGGVCRSVHVGYCDIEQNGIVFNIGFQQFMLTCEKCYVESNDKIFNCYTGRNMYKSYIEISECYLTQGDSAGWVLTTTSFEKTDAEPFVFVFENNQIFTEGGSLVKPFKVDGNGNYTFLALVVKENYFQAIPTTIFDLIEKNSELKYMIPYFYNLIDSDLPAISTGNVKAFYNVIGNYRSGSNTKLVCNVWGYYEPDEQQSGVESFTISKFNNIQPTSTRLDTVTAKMGDDTYKVLQVAFTDAGIVIYKQTAETVKRIYFNNKYVLG